MAKQKITVPKRIAGIKIKKRHRKQLKMLAEQIARVEELVAAGTAILALLGLNQKVTGQEDKIDKLDRRQRRSEHNPALAH